MRRAVNVLVAFVVTATMLTAVTSGEAFAKSNCGTDVSSTTMDGMEMGGSKTSMEQHCPVVAGGRKIAVTGDDFSFSPARITMKAGETVTIALTASDVAHDLYVQSIGHVVHAKADKTARGSIRIKKAGTYKFWCTILGHRKQGMTGTITVT